MKRFISQTIFFFKKVYNSRQPWIVTIAIGLWIIVLQNFGVFSNNSDGAQSVYVVGGEVDASVNGNVEIDNTVPVYVTGGEVEVDGSVWVDGGIISTL